jgi:hypothetical protein
VAGAALTLWDFAEEVGPAALALLQAAGRQAVGEGSDMFGFYEIRVIRVP